MLASEVLTHSAKVYLNDALQQTWTNTVLLPQLSEAVLRLEELLRLNEIPFEKKVSIPIDVLMGTTEINQYPTDFIEPISLRERERASASDWSDELPEVVDINPNLVRSLKIVQWSFSAGQVFINPPTTDREVLLKYLARLTPVVAEGSLIDIAESKSFLAAMTAEITARNLGNNPTKADAINAQAFNLGDTLIKTMLKNSQGVGGVRRKGYQYTRRGR